MTNFLPALVTGLVIAFFPFDLGYSVAKAQDLACNNGAPAAQPYCKYFIRYNRDSSYKDARLVRALSLGQGETTRSIAIILGVSQYHRAQNQELLPAKTDVDNLKTFIVDTQRFDEVILLENDDVNLDNIAYFLQVYVPQVAPRYTKPRVLFAYSGHGVASDTANTKGYIVLSQAIDEKDLQHLISLGVLAEYFRNVAPRTFQFLAVINACYGGDVFGVTQGGGNIFLTNVPGANALTAGAPDELVYSLGHQGQGSIFFDGLIDGVNSGRAAADYVRNDISGKIITGRRDVIRLGDLLRYMTDNVQAINESFTPKKDYSVPWAGSAEPASPNPKASRGGFVFLSGASEITAFGFGSQEPPPSGPVSSLYGRPDAKVFNAPYEYPIQGVDVSQNDGLIDWEAVKAGGNLFRYPIRFAFARATMGAERKDDTFRQNWEGAASANLLRGAYHVHDFCESVAQQLSNIKRNVPTDPIALPIAVDVEIYPGASATEFQKRQVDCLRRDGAALARQNLQNLLTDLESQYSKKPVVVGNKNAFAEIVDETFSRYSVWLHDYRAPGTGMELPGKNPWTMWQYTDTARVVGINDRVDASAFFGTEDDFAKFRDTGQNISLEGANDPARDPARRTN